MVATRTSFRTESPPEQRKSLDLFEIYSPGEMARIQQGFVPRDMDDRWFIFFEDHWLNIYRSWTGFQVFALRFEMVGDGSGALSGGWINGDPSQYQSDGRSSDCALAFDLISGLLLGVQK